MTHLQHGELVLRPITNHDPFVLIEYRKAQHLITDAFAHSRKESFVQPTNTVSSDDGGHSFHDTLPTILRGEGVRKGFEVQVKCVVVVVVVAGGRDSRGGRGGGLTC